MKIPDLPLNSAGVPIPWVHMQKGRSLAACCRHRRCWICGLPMTKREAYVVTPETTLSYTVDRPPACPDCARFFLRMQVGPEAKLLAIWLCHHKDGYPKRFDDGVVIETPDGRDVQEFKLVTQLPHVVEWYTLNAMEEPRVSTAEEVAAAINQTFDDRFRTCPHAEERQALLEARSHALAFWVPVPNPPPANP